MEHRKTYLRPSRLDEAVAALASGGRAIVAGGTDVYPAAGTRPLLRPIVDVSQVQELRAIHRTPAEIRIGGAVTWTEIANATLPPSCQALQAAARDIGSIQIQNRATIAGNLTNASPAADGVPALLIVDAEVELVSVSGTRRLPLSSYITGYRQTARRDDEILSAVIMPHRPGASAFCKLGSRRYLVISILMVAALIERSPDGGIGTAAVAIGAASPIAQRLPALERDLLKLRPGTRPSTVVTADHVLALSPLDDGRATARYRREAARIVIGRALDMAFDGSETG